MESMAYIRQGWIGKRIVAYSKEVFGDEMGQYVCIHHITEQWVEVEKLDKNKKSTGEIYLIPSVHIYFKAKTE